MGLDYRIRKNEVLSHKFHSSGNHFQMCVVINLSFKVKGAEENHFLQSDYERDILYHLCDWKELENQPCNIWVKWSKCVFSNHNKHVACSFTVFLSRRGSDLFFLLLFSFLLLVCNNCISKIRQCDFLVFLIIY